ncbi:hypothetical protein Glove_578g35 [Diversispora epigaea]|uniref:Needs CLA4 to survive protein 3 n=1 Tax=Diversispora epigaea TaxID=1348612 RepID=A0A397G948_9GLOM|nr:hypothetical protein Glove_578g35 [Diversispora epigaea]
MKVSELLEENAKLLNRVNELEIQVEKLKLEKNSIQDKLNKLTELNKLNEVNDLNKVIELKELNESQSDQNDDNGKEKGLKLKEYLRYGRQLILPDFGISGQIKIKNSSILVVGAGGLGAPTSIYLAAAGVGTIGIIDYDDVEISNLHRQIIHNESRVGISKVQSAKMTIEGLNSDCNCIAYNMVLDSSNALDIIKKYDIVIDATDNVATRYLLNDACVLSGKPLVSGSALRMEGQLVIYNYRGGPCFRCLFPKPPPPEAVMNCSDNGVLGVVPGVIGCLQALQAIKIIADIRDDGSFNDLLLFSATSYTIFKSIRLRPRKSNCAICGENPTIKTLQDYIQFCGSGPLDKSPPVKLLKEDRRIDPKTYNEICLKKIPHLLIDVREPVQYDICSLPDSWNIPLRELSDKLEDVQKRLTSSTTSIYVVCRYGNDSQLGVDILKNITKGEVKDIIGGLHKWALDIDHDFPIY